MHFALKGMVEVFAQEWYVFCAYFASYVLLEVRRTGSRSLRIVSFVTRSGRHLS